MRLEIAKNYEILIEPNFKNFTFFGQEKISLLVKQPTNKLILNSVDMKIIKCFLIFNGKTIFLQTNLNEEKEELTIRIPEIIKGKIELFIHFIGILNDKLVGFYRSQYKDERNNNKIMATTQFEAADARRAFPCWDEPEAKATFDISLKVDSNLTAISNMPIKSIKREGTKSTYTFQRTPIMSTYLVYLGVGELEFLKSKVGKTSIRIVTLKGKKNLGKLSLQFAKQFLGFFENYFKIPYPLPKLDLISVPDFASGAMENWGAITFRETILLYDPKTSSTETKQHIAEVIAHEIAHQWFGNLVTMKWWNELWLNESFATFMATKAVNTFYPNWDLWDQFLISETSGAMSLDSLKSSHPIDVKVNKPSEVREIFDEISYNKGGTVLRMLENYLGEKNFRLGLKNYLLKHKYGNASTKDLWSSLEKKSGKPVRKVMNSWIRQVGYPLIEANLTNSKLNLKQTRFLSENMEKLNKEKWVVPISIQTPGNISHQLLDTRSKSFLIQTKSWFKINANQIGMYRVKYDENELAKFQELVSLKILNNKDRWGLQHDFFSFCISGQFSLKKYLEFIYSYQDEDDYLVLQNLVENLDFLYLITSREGFWNEIKEFNVRFFQRWFENIGWDKKPPEKHTTALLRSSLVGSLGKLGVREIYETSQEKFLKFLKNPQSLDPDLRNSVYSVSAWCGNAKTYKIILNGFKKSYLQEEKLRFLGALSSFQDKNLLLKTLKLILTNEVRSQNLHLPIMRMASNPYGRDLVWPWMKKNWKIIVKKFGVGSPLLNRVVGTIPLIARSDQETEIRKFFAKNSTPGTHMKLAQSLEKLKIYSRFIQRSRSEFLT